MQSSVPPDGSRREGASKAALTSILPPHAKTFDEYWLGYLAGHAHLSTRAMHYLGLFVAPLAGLALSILYAWWAFLVVAPLFYVAALLTHPLVEHNSNKPFAERPVWSALALLRMLALDLTGRLGSHLRRAGVPSGAGR